MLELELRAFPLFAGVSDEALAAVARGGIVELSASQVAVQAGDSASGMYLVLAGEVVVELRDGPVEMGPGEFFGELGLIVPDAERVARVRAATDARLVSLPRETFDLLLETEPSFARALVRELAERLVFARTRR